MRLSSPDPPSLSRFAGVAQGFAGLLAGAAIGPMLEPDCHCGDQGMAGGFYGAMIGAPLGALLGVWLAR